MMESHRYDFEDGNSIVIYKSDDILEITGELFGSDVEFFRGSPNDDWEKEMGNVIISLNDYVQKLDDTISDFAE